MSKRLDPPENCRTTDHSDEVARLRAVTKRCMELSELGGWDTEITLGDFTLPVMVMGAVTECAAALLEVHDDTGISLDNWVGPRELCELALLIIGADEAFLVNGI